MNVVKSEEPLKKLALASRDYLKRLDLALQPTALSSSTYYYILKLAEYGDLPQEKLVQLTNINPSNVTRAIKQLIDLGLVSKIPNPNDRRAFVLSLTKKGTDIYPKIVQILKDTDTTFLTPLSKQERDAFVIALNKLI